MQEACNVAKQKREASENALEVSQALKNWVLLTFLDPFAPHHPSHRGHKTNTRVTFSNCALIIDGRSEATGD
jgi:hypothetical protein